MSRPRFEVGDTVETSHPIGRGEAVKRQIGTVVELVNGGMKVEVPGLFGTIFVPTNRAKLVTSRADERAARRAQAEGPALHVVPAPEEPAADPPKAPTQAPAPLNLSALEAQGIDPLALFLALGRDLVVRADERVEAARVQLAKAQDDEREAEALLADARAGVATARAAMAEAEQARATLAAKVGP